MHLNALRSQPVSIPISPSFCLAVRLLRESSLAKKLPDFSSGKALDSMEE
jgi:hypothetical protein